MQQLRSFGCPSHSSLCLRRGEFGCGSIHRPLFVFDLEHTGGVKENQSITEIGAYVVFPSGDIEHVTSLVKPPKDVSFHPIVSKITGIDEWKVRKAPSWDSVFLDLVAPYQDAIWVGFNSKASDVPLIIEECSRSGIEIAAPEHHLDLMKFGEVSGSLSERLAQLNPDADLTGAHRASADALMTLHLLEAMIPDLPLRAFSRAIGIDQPSSSAPATTAISSSSTKKAPKPEKETRVLQKQVPKAVFSEPEEVFLVREAGLRAGKKWGVEETNWVIESYKFDISLEEIGIAIGRNARSAAYVVAKAGFLPEEDVIAFNLDKTKY